MNKTNVNLDIESVEVREQRLGAITSWHGKSAAELVEQALCGSLKEDA